MKLVKEILIFLSLMLLINSEMATNFSPLPKTPTQKRKRYTKDGRKCAENFVQDGKVYGDCTTSKSPDGQIKNEEWCYVEAPEKGAKQWDYCKPVMDWDKARQKAQELYEKFARECRIVKASVSTVMNPGNQAIRKLNNVKTEQNELDSRVNDLINEAQVIMENVDSLNNAKIQWSQLENQCLDIYAQIKEVELEKELLEKEKGIIDIDPSQRKEEKMDTSEDIIRDEQKQCGAAINPMLQEKIITTETNCEGFENYDIETEGTGLNVFYFPNPDYIGIPVSQIDPLLDYESLILPDQIPSKSFSIVWKGFIKPPIDGDYQFSVESSTEVSIVLNGNNIFYSNLAIKGKDTTGNIHLTGEKLYPIVIRLRYNSHSSNIIKNHFKFLWVNKVFGEKIVETRYLYPALIKDSIRINIDQKIGVTKRLYENDLAFKDSLNYIIQDIPDDYKGLQAIKLNFNKEDGKENKEIEFEINQDDVVMYFAKLYGSPLNIEGVYYDLSDYLSILEIDNQEIAKVKDNKNLSGPRKIKSKNAYVMKIYKRYINKGKNKITFSKFGGSPIENAFMVFFGYDNKKHLQCGGKLEKISNPQRKSFAGCHASSGNSCKEAFAEGNRMWSSNEGIGAWIEIDFDQFYEISKIDYRNKNNPSERNSEIKIVFSNGEEKVFPLKNINHIQTLRIEPPIRARGLKVFITKVYGTIRNGGHFDIYGTKCVFEKTEQEESQKYEIFPLKDSIKPLFGGEEESNFYSLSCSDSLINTKKIPQSDIIHGKTFKILCVDACKNEMYNIYGNKKYSIDSVICKAAYHSGVLGKEGGMIEMKYTEESVSFASATNNEVISKHKPKGYATISFSNVPNSYSSNKSNAQNKKNTITIKFAPKNYINKNLSKSKYRFDNGLVFGQNNNPYGWNSNMSNKMKKATGGTIIQDSYVEMIPDKKCKWCSTTNCQEIPWGVYTGEGQFKVKVYVSDIYANSIINLVLNGIRIADSVFVPKGDTMMFEGKIDADERGMITLTSECINNCDYAVTKFNMITIDKI